MPFSRYTTVLTTDGVKTLQQLENVPFKAIVNENIFPCHYGSHKVKNSDLYLIKTSGAHTLLTTLDQRFLTEKGTFRNIQDFRLGDKLVLTIPRNYPFGGIEPLSYDLDTIDQNYEFYNSNFYKIFFRHLFRKYGSFNEKGIVFFLGLQDDIKENCNLITRMLARFSIISSTTVRRRTIVGVQITNRNLLNYLTYIGFDNDEDETQAYNHLIETPPSDVHRTTFKSLTYFDTQMSYSCEIEGAKAFDANCFYAHDLTFY